MNTIYQQFLFMCLNSRCVELSAIKQKAIADMVELGGDKDTAFQVVSVYPEAKLIEDYEGALDDLYRDYWQTTGW